MRETTRDYLFMIHTVYIVKCIDNSLYVGSTNNLEARMKEHNNSKKGAHYTKIRRPVVLVYTEEYATLQDARRREAEIKRWRKEKKIKLIYGD
jgi:putative endonuclease